MTFPKMPANSPSSLATSPGKPGGVAAMPLPREHGAWGILAVSYLLGLAVARDATWASLLCGAAALLAMLGRRPTANALRTRGARLADLGWSIALLGAAAGAAAVALALRPDLWPIFAVVATLFGADLAMLVVRLGRTAWGEMPGILGLALASVLGHASASPALGERSWALGLVCALYFVGSIPFVRGFVRARAAFARSDGTARLAAQPAALYYLAALNVTGLLGLVRAIPLLAPAALLPAALKALWLSFGRARLDRRVQVLGVLEVFHSLVFAGLAWLAFYF
jgi:hypothetical protein